MCEKVRAERLDIVRHYDKLVEAGDDPARDGPQLRAYMDKWDGARFIDCMRLDKSKSVLEVGVGTGRMAARVADRCGRFCGIDISSKAIARAKINLGAHANVALICADFMDFEFSESFDVVYSTLTFMHFEDKRAAIKRCARLLNDGGRFVLSIDKNRSDHIDAGISRIKVYPDTPEEIAQELKARR